MSAVGGSIESITLDGRTFSVTADTDSGRKIGGFENDFQANGDGTGRLIKTRIPFMVDGLVISIDDDNSDQEFLQDLADRNGLWPLTATYASGAIWQGNGQIVGELTFSNASSAATVGLSGEGKFVQQ